jgi:hypothetical protein
VNDLIDRLDALHAESFGANPASVWALRNAWPRVSRVLRAALEVAEQSRRVLPPLATDLGISDKLAALDAALAAGKEDAK